MRLEMVSEMCDEAVIDTSPAHMVVSVGRVLKQRQTYGRTMRTKDSGYIHGTKRATSTTENTRMTRRQ